ncbi:MAG: inositol monophosphatase [Bdellovibrio sp.]|nr:MAG: inositol monophosphatase [Bdellovibrio sp.]
MERRLNDLMSGAKKAALLGRDVLLHYFKDIKHISEKAKAGLVSEADTTSEEVIIHFLKEAFPEIGFIAEEDSFKKKKLSWEQERQTGKFWIIDPLDGTTNYIYGFPVYCISIGLFLEGQTKLGVIDVPSLKTTYTAIKGEGAYKNDIPIEVSQRKMLEESLLATGFYHEDEPFLEEQIKIFSQLVKKARGIRRAGAAAFDLCMVAEGVFDAYWERNLKPWDTCAGELLVREAGGVVTTYEGSPYSPFGSSILSGNALVHKELLEVIRPIVVPSS